MQAPKEGTGTTAIGAPIQLALDLEGGAEGPRTQRIHRLLKEKKKTPFFLLVSVGRSLLQKWARGMGGEGPAPSDASPGTSAARSPVAGSLHPWEGDRATKTVAQREEVPGALFLGNGKGLLHLDLAAVCDRHILQRLVPPIGLGAFHLPYYILGRKAECQVCAARGTGPRVQLGGLRPTGGTAYKP